MIFVKAVDAAGVAAAADLVYLIHHLERVLKLALIFVDGKKGGELFAGELELLADTLAVDHHELAVRGDLEASLAAELLR